MSADNGVYIVKFPEGYRVAHAQAIENIDYFPKGSKKRKKELASYFGRSKVHNTEEEAWKEARSIYDEIMKDSDCPIVEYGICYLGEYEGFIEKDINEDKVQEIINKVWQGVKAELCKDMLPSEAFYLVGQLTYNPVKEALIAKDKEIKELRDWKDSAIKHTPDYQAIGKELNITWGDSIHDKILPGIIKLKEEIKELKNGA